MKFSKLQHLFSILKSREGFSLVLFVTFALSFFINTGFRIIRAYQLEGGWTVFDSQNRLVGDDDPDGFLIEYPAGWEEIAYSGGSVKNLGDARAYFVYPYFLFSGKTYVYIWWRRVDDSWALEDVREWYVEDVNFGSNPNTFHETAIGVRNYPALQGISSRERVVFFVVEDEAFAIECHAQSYSKYSKMEAIFERMLNSIEVYE